VEGPVRLAHPDRVDAKTGCCSITRSGSPRHSATRDASYTLAVEQFMQRYYRTVMDVSLLNELLLQLFARPF